MPQHIIYKPLHYNITSMHIFLLLSYFLTAVPCICIHTTVKQCFVLQLCSSITRVRNNKRSARTWEAGSILVWVDLSWHLHPAAKQTHKNSTDGFHQTCLEEPANSSVDRNNCCSCRDKDKGLIEFWNTDGWHFQTTFTSLLLPPSNQVTKRLPTFSERQKQLRRSVYRMNLSLSDNHFKATS